MAFVGDIMKIFQAVIIEQSLKNKNTLNNFKIINRKKSGDWVLDILEITDISKTIEIIQPEMVEDKPYYWHIYDDNHMLVIIFREKVFHLDPTDHSTWKEAQKYGSKLLRIPEEQLDFYPTQFSDEPEWLAGKD